jgi:hypothetical protein
LKTETDCAAVTTSFQLDGHDGGKVQRGADVDCLVPPISDTTGLESSEAGFGVRLSCGPPEKTSGGREGWMGRNKLQLLAGCPCLTIPATFRYGSYSA